LDDPSARAVRFQVVCLYVSSVFRGRIEQMTKAKRIVDIRPLLFLNRARQFHDASERVFGGHQRLDMPLYFLYFHTLELAFKAFLRHHNVPTSELKFKKGHRLAELYEDCRNLGFVIGPSDRTDIGNVVSLLEGANECEGLRYFNPDLKCLPSLSWTREVVREVIRVVGSLVEPVPTPPGPATKFVFTFDKPR
jgi:hypothetical protein